MLDYYFKLLGDIPEFLEKYLKVPSLIRLKKVGYFCGMDYASKDIYNFSEKITRYDHSLSVALLTYKLTKRKKDTIAALFHDIATPCFSHVIDYMNKDYEKQESTEEYTEIILRNDKYFNECLKIDRIKIEDVINFKKYSIVDNDRPKLCADRLDGVILTGIGWTKNINNATILLIMNDIEVDLNEEHMPEICFKTKEVALMVKEISKKIDIYCHSNEDNYMMELLAKITKYAIEKRLITYSDLYYLTEKELFKIFESANDKTLNKLLLEFYNKKKKDIPELKIQNIKIRKLNPLVNGIRV